MSFILTHADLVSRGRKWLSRPVESKKLRDRLGTMGVILTEYKCYANSIPDVIGFNSQQSVVIECKVTRSDFLHDFRKGHRHYRSQLGNYRFYLCTPDIVCAQDVPEGWGLLYCQANRIDIIKPSEYFTVGTRDEEYSILYSLCRRAEIRGLIPELVKPLEIKALGK